MTTKLERLDHSVSHEWHVAVNACASERGHNDWPKFMYEAKTAADEVPRMALLFRLEREAKLTKTHQHCSHCEPEPVKDNHLTCCLGTKCRECPFLLALETAKLTPEQIDQAKAWTCATHIISKGGDMMNEGYLLTVDDRMYWDRLHSSLASARPEVRCSEWVDDWERRVNEAYNEMQDAWAEAEEFEKYAREAEDKYLQIKDEYEAAKSSTHKLAD